MLVVGGVIGAQFRSRVGQASFSARVTVPAKSMTKPLTDFRTGHRTVSFRMTSTVTGFFFAV
jgi:hypothetical protein